MLRRSNYFFRTLIISLGAHLIIFILYQNLFSNYFLKNNLITLYPLDNKNNRLILIRLDNEKEDEQKETDSPTVSSINKKHFVRENKDGLEIFVKKGEIDSKQKKNLNQKELKKSVSSFFSIKFNQNKVEKQNSLSQNNKNLEIIQKILPNNNPVKSEESINKKNNQQNQSNDSSLLSKHSFAEVTFNNGEYFQISNVLIRKSSFDNLYHQLGSQKNKYADFFYTYAKNLAESLFNYIRTVQIFYADSFAMRTSINQEGQIEIESILNNSKRQEKRLLHIMRGSVLNAKPIDKTPNEIFKDGSKLFLDNYILVTKNPDYPNRIIVEFNFKLAH